MKAVPAGEYRYMNEKKKLTRKKLAFLLLMSGFGCLGPLVREISLPTICIVWARALVSAAALLLFLLRSGKRNLKDCRSFLKPMLMCGVLLAVDWIGLFASYRYTTIATATLCYYIVPALVMIGAACFLGEKLTARKLICIAVAFAGMVFVSGAAGNGLPKPAEIKGVLLALVGAAGYAGIILINKRYPEGDPLMRTFIQLSTAALIMTGYLSVAGELPAGPFGTKDILLLLILGVGMTAAAYIAYFALIISIPSGTVAFFSYADPVVAVILSIFLLNEPFTIHTLIGAVMIIGAAAAAECFPEEESL